MNNYYEHRMIVKIGDKSIKTIYQFAFYDEFFRENALKFAQEIFVEQQTEKINEIVKKDDYVCFETEDGNLVFNSSNLENIEIFHQFRKTNNETYKS